MTGTVAKPSNPSVKLTALEDPIITNNANGIKKIQFFPNLLVSHCLFIAVQLKGGGYLGIVQGVS